VQVKSEGRRELPAGKGGTGRLGVGGFLRLNKLLSE
jgi:hypothetical protein